MKWYRYHWLYIPSKKRGIGFFDPEHPEHFKPDGVSELTALRRIDQWNLAGTGRWQYWTNASDCFVPVEDKTSEGDGC
jgi:hypothetical protein